MTEQDFRTVLLEALQEAPQGSQERAYYVQRLSDSLVADLNDEGLDDLDEIVGGRRV